MESIKVSGFDWDSGNLFKNEFKHGLSREIIELFFHRNVFVAQDPVHSKTEDRFLAIGMDGNGRPMIVAFTLREQSGIKKIRPISARYMHEKEIKKYEEAFTHNEK
ncbi:MAG: BrnT family toxin [Bacteriovoracaceae bacterium]|nr:BrnT family toxin [Bacteriovoracaceae bacterium]